MEKSASGENQQDANSSIKNENENTEIQDESRTSSGSENQNEQSEIDIEAMLKRIKFFVSNECRIHRVPYHLRKWNVEAYTPQVISVGPYHHGKKEFRPMEKHKERYFNCFMQRARAAGADINEEKLLSVIKDMEDRIRRCYVETVPLGSKKFVRMISMDASFILELFLKSYECKWEIDDPIVMEGWLLSKICHELLLLENQLPFYVIEKLYHLLPSCSTFPSLIQLAFDFFESFNIHKKASNVEIQIQHFTDLLRLFQLPPKKLASREKKIIFPKYSATQLHEAGVKFKVVASKCVLDLSFEEGVLKIPLLEFMDSTEAHIRNIMALEQCDIRIDPYITDFYLILDRLVNTTKDVDLHCDEEIIVNGLGDNNAVTSMINNLNRGIFRDDMNLDYSHACEALNKFYEVPWHKWKAILRHQYFSTPWRAASTIAAIILLVLTLLQTIFTIKKWYRFNVYVI